MENEEKMREMMDLSRGKTVIVKEKKSREDFQGAKKIIKKKVDKKIGSKKSWDG